MYRFSVTLNNLVKLNSDGSASFKFVPSNFIIPSQYIKPGMASTLQDLISSLPKGDLYFSYQVAASGFIESSQCIEPSILYADLIFNDGVPTKTVTIASVAILPNGSNLNTGWINFKYPTVTLPTELNFYQTCGGYGCAPSGCSSDIWGNISVSFNIIVTINNSGYCIKNPQDKNCLHITPLPSIDTFSNIHNDNYMYYQSYWHRNRTAIIWFIVIILVIIIIVAIVLATNKKQWFKRKYNK